MNVVTDLGERRRRKQWKFERSMLRALSIEDMRKDVQEQFFDQLVGQSVGKLYLVDYCLDIGIDAYLLGSEFGRFGYYGETAEQAQHRCIEEINAYIEQTTGQFKSWFTLDEVETTIQHEKSRAFILRWWNKGFAEGEKKYRLRLH
ncbi:YbaK family protein [Evansella cellulosilytica]|uniref:DUF2521 family protein n=1 Tax=Evansella cellulosilytica (strain ATCC 21833 / DSM 2522 / FERM P-1141 / JCM 9156 / N-4) TaxID=649639 RepID=E6TTA9_EVAC2|nr:YbaK family protein [Evansella cellulosilytica]ADU28449.1 Protein of unknown function DUF2521 [Evansella cellulosilytica DSM 2522]